MNNYWKSVAQYFRRPCTYSRVVPGAGGCESESVLGFLSGAGVELCCAITILVTQCGVAAVAGAG